MWLGLDRDAGNGIDFCCRLQATFLQPAEGRLTMPHRIQFRLRSLFWLTLWAAVTCVVGPPAWTWAKAKFFSDQWREVGGPGAIQPFSCSISCGFTVSRMHSDRARALRLARRLGSLRSRRSPKRIARAWPRRPAPDDSANVAVFTPVD
jgi:hypothetical protein